MLLFQSCHLVQSFAKVHYEHKLFLGTKICTPHSILLGVATSSFSRFTQI